MDTSNPVGKNEIGTVVKYLIYFELSNLPIFVTLVYLLSDPYAKISSGNLRTRSISHSACQGGGTELSKYLSKM